jgi:hypothetical protein
LARESRQRPSSLSALTTTRTIEETMNIDNETELPLSDLMRALETAMRERPVKTIPVDQSLINWAEKPIGLISFRVVTVHEQNESLKASEDYLRENLKDQPRLLDDPDYVNNIRSAHILWRACRDGVDPSMPAFRSPRWMLRTFSAQLISKLIGYYNECLRASEPLSNWFQDDEKLETLIAFCFDNYSNDEPNVSLAYLSKEQLAEVVIRLSLKVMEARSAAAKVQ